MTTESELEGFVSKFAPDMQAHIRACRAALVALLPQAVQLVYDNYNFFVIGFGPTRRTSEAVFSLACQRSGVSLVFLQRGPELPDPTLLLRGDGKVVRSVRLESADDLERSEVRALVDAELALCRVPMDLAEGPEVIIKSVSAKQRPRR